MITVFTPTYNRKYRIDKLYKSLLEQTNLNFEWLVIDDGSTDNTEDYFKEILKNDNPFEITYIKQENGGKHRAINLGVQKANGDLFFIVDSDDYLLPKAIEKIYSWAKTLDKSHKWAGVSGLRGYSNSIKIGGGGNKLYTDAKNTERRKYHLLGDKAEVYFTDVLKKFPFPEFGGENFITEEVVWNEIAYDDYYIRWFNEIIYITEYLDDGLTQNYQIKNKKNPQGLLYWARQHLNIYKHKPHEIYTVIHVYYEAVKDKKSKKEISRDLNVSSLLMNVCLSIYKLINIIKK